jgi:hypothetical protein
VSDPRSWGVGSTPPRPWGSLTPRSSVSMSSPEPKQFDHAKCNDNAGCGRSRCREMSRSCSRRSARCGGRLDSDRDALLTTRFPTTCSGHAGVARSSLRGRFCGSARPRQGFARFARRCAALTRPACSRLIGQLSERRPDRRRVGPATTDAAATRRRTRSFGVTSPSACGRHPATLP